MANTENTGGVAAAAPFRRKPGRPRKVKPATADPLPGPAQDLNPALPLAADEHGNQFPPPAPDIAAPPAGPQAAPAHTGPTNNTNYRDDEIRNLLCQISKFKPYTDDAWNKVVDAFNAETTYPPRTLKSLTEKFRKLKDMKKPTGNPQANVFHEKALECEREIHNLTATFGINDEHASDEDIEVTGFREGSPAWNIPGMDGFSSDSDVQVLNDAERAKPNTQPRHDPAAAYAAASSKSSAKRKADTNQPQRAAPAARREPTKLAALRTNAGHLQRGVERLIDNTNPEVERSLNTQRHQDSLAQIQLASLLEEVRSLRSQLDTERERRAELSSKLQRYELLEDMRRIAAPGTGYAPGFMPGHFTQPHLPLAQVAPAFAPVAPVVPNAPVDLMPVPKDHIDPQLFP